MNYMAGKALGNVLMEGYGMEGAGALLLLVVLHLNFSTTSK